MKKFFTLIAFISAFIPAVHGMEASLPADMQKQYDHLEILIKNADVQAFKPAFDVANLPSESITGLEQLVAETKVVVDKELEALGDKNKSWSKIAKGTLATVGGSTIGVSVIRALFDKEELLSIKNRVLENSKYLKQFGGDLLNDITFYCGVGITASCCFAITYAGLIYGIKNLKAGLNYKQYLQDQLANLDAIAAHIVQAEEQAAHA